MANTKTFTAGARVTTWHGQTGTVQYRTKDGWYGVHCDGEYGVSGGPRVDEWQSSQLEAA